MKTYAYLMFMAGIMFTLNLIGVDTASGMIINFVGNILDGSFGVSDLFTTAGGIFTLALGATIIAGLYFQASPESFLLAGYTTILIGFVADMVSLLIYLEDIGAAEWMSGGLLLVVAPLAIGYVHSVVSWWGGKS